MKYTSKVQKKTNAETVNQKRFTIFSLPKKKKGKQKMKNINEKILGADVDQQLCQATKIQITNCKLSKRVQKKLIKHVTKKPRKGAFLMYGNF